MIQRPRGTNDLVSPEVETWQETEAFFRDVARRYAFGEIRTPIFEATELFERGAGSGSDIVRKEMYTFRDRGGRSLTLRPEGTSPVVRWYLETQAKGIQKKYYIQPQFRYERPQAGRFRQHFQFGCETLGTPSPVADAEIIDFLFAFLGGLGLTGIRVGLNSIGCALCRPGYREALVTHFQGVQDRLCDDCKVRLETNPLRILDCKNEGCASADEDVPLSVDHLCQACRTHFDTVLACLRSLGRPYDLAPRLVRGIDYYTRTVFEITHDSLGAQSAVAGGGRYDGLAEALGGPPTPGVGFGMGIERLVTTLASIGEKAERDRSHALYIALPDPSLGPSLLPLAGELRGQGVEVEVDLTGRSLKAQIREADRGGYGRVAIYGPEEAREGVMTLRNMRDGIQTTVAAAALADALSGGETS